MLDIILLLKTRSSHKTQADSNPQDGRLSQQEAQSAMDLISAGLQDRVRTSMQRALAQRQ